MTERYRLGLQNRSPRFDSGSHIQILWGPSLNGRAALCGSVYESSILSGPPKFCEGSNDGSRTRLKNAGCRFDSDPSHQVRVVNQGGPWHGPENRWYPGGYGDRHYRPPANEVLRSVGRDGGRRRFAKPIDLQRS